MGWTKPCVFIFIETTIPMFIFFPKISVFISKSKGSLIHATFICYTFISLARVLVVCIQREHFDCMWYICCQKDTQRVQSLFYMCNIVMAGLGTDYGNFVSSEQTGRQAIYGHWILLYISLLEPARMLQSYIFYIYMYKEWPAR